jgi:hypothetical protein
VVAEVHLVQVRLEDPVLFVLVLELEREACLLRLPLERFLAADVEVADELLRDGRAALDDLPLFEVPDRRADDRFVVEAAVLVEAPVLDRDRRLRDPRGHLRESHRLAVALGRDGSEQRAVRRVDERVLADRDRLERAEVTAGAKRGRRRERRRGERRKAAKDDCEG